MPQLESAEEIARAKAAEKAQARVRELEAQLSSCRKEVLGEVGGKLEKRFEDRIATERIWKSKAAPGLGAARANARVRAFEEAEEEALDVLDRASLEYQPSTPDHDRSETVTQKDIDRGLELDQEHGWSEGSRVDEEACEPFYEDPMDAGLANTDRRQNREAREEAAAPQVDEAESSEGREGREWKARARLGFDLHETAVQRAEDAEKRLGVILDEADHILSHFSEETPMGGFASDVRRLAETPQPTTGETPEAGMRPASRRRLGLEAAVLLALEAEILPSTVREIVGEVLDSQGRSEPTLNRVGTLSFSYSDDALGSDCTCCEGAHCYGAGIRFAKDTITGMVTDFVWPLRHRGLEGRSVEVAFRLLPPDCNPHSTTESKEDR
jgi:hypothetical protein